MAYNYQILGTVIASVLDYDHLVTITGDPKVIDPTTTNWIPADGRNIAGSNLSKLTKALNAPDLRGRFLRGLNTIFSDGAPELNISTADQGDPHNNRTAGDYQDSVVGAHSHVVDMRTGYMMDLGKWQNPPPTSIYIADRPAFGNDYGNLTASSNGSGMAPETRPKNIAVYYYIKIN
jgi:hypothetical protein